MITKQNKIRPAILNVHALSKAFNIYPIFQNISFQLNQGEKVALVGVNGAGKSTLLKLLAGQEQLDTGEIVWARGLKVAYLPQEAEDSFGGEASLYDEMLVVFGELRQMESELAALQTRMGEFSGDERAWQNLLNRYAALAEQFEREGGYNYEPRIQQVLTGLNFGPADWERPVGEFSGGQKTRVALARVLLAGPDLLLLDEPTNHLDLATLQWLESFLAEWEGSLIVISHDRYFLDRVVSRVLDLSFGRLEDYPGNYSKYIGLRAERRERALKEYEAQQEHIAKTEEFIRRFRAGQRAKEAQGRQKLLDRLDRVERPVEHSRLRAKLPGAERSGRVVLTLNELIIGWDEQPLVALPKLAVERGARIALVGPNGCGKSTLLKTLTGEIPALLGRVQFGENVRVAYYAQSHDDLNPRLTVLEEIRQLYPVSEEQVRTYLGRFLFSGDNVFKRVGDLSGGERSRLALAKLSLARANFLLLDEPTNHLDLYSRQALEELLASYDGTLLFVSHDRYFIDSLATQVWEIAAGELRVYEGNYSHYRQQVA